MPARSHATTRVRSSSHVKPTCGRYTPTSIAPESVCPFPRREASKSRQVAGSEGSAPACIVARTRRIGAFLAHQPYDDQANLPLFGYRREHISRTANRYDRLACNPPFELS